MPVAVHAAGSHMCDDDWIKTALEAFNACDARNLCLPRLLLLHCCCCAAR
jgi:hypothetical protein